MALVRSLVENLFDRGIREFVICAGARNIPLVEAITGSDSVYLWNHFEERSAGFFALGRTMSSGEPCCIVTTSGTAVAELLPAVVEGFYQGRPLVILSADRPARFRGTGAPQTIEQVGIFGDYVEQCHDVGHAAPDLTAWSGLRPLHINVCIEELEEVQKVSGQVQAFSIRQPKYQLGTLYKFIEESWDGLVVALGGLEPEHREEVFHFLKDLKVPVIADATSGLREALGRQLVANAEGIFDKNRVGKLLRIGDVPVGRFWRDLETHQQVNVFSITTNGFSGLARPSQLLQGDISRILKGLGGIQEVGDTLGLLAHNARNWAKIDELLESYPDSEPGMVRVLSHYASMSGHLYLGNSLPIRQWNQFAQREIPTEFVRANRGANGIDGQISTWLGCSAGVEDSWCVIGDLTALYDITALSLWHQVSGSKRVMVILNNGGGKIFERLPQVRNMARETRQRIENAHGLNFENLAKTWNIEYQCYTSTNGMEVHAPERGLIVEVRPDLEQTQLFWQNLRE